MLEILSRRVSYDSYGAMRVREGPKYKLVSPQYTENLLKKVFLPRRRIGSSLIIGNLISSLILGLLGNNEKSLVMVRYLGEGTFEYARNGDEPVERNLIDMRIAGSKVGFSRPSSGNDNDWTFNFGISGFIDVEEIYHDVAIVSYRKQWQL